jgi:hypothetical protein
MVWSAPIRILVLSLVILVIAPCLVTGQEKTVRGTVTDTSGLAISGATVFQLHSSRGTVTGDDGTFILTTGPAGSDTITLIISFIGYRTDTLMLGENFRSDEIHLILRPETTDIEEIEVRARRPDNVTVIGIPAVAGMVIPSVSGGIESAVSTLPGVSAFSELSSAYSVRGGSYDENLVYIKMWRYIGPI